MKCPYCKGKNLRLAATWPVDKWVCRDCEEKAKLLLAKGLTKSEIEKILKK